MQIPICPLCKSEDNEECFSERGYKVLVCNNCDLFFINPYPTDGDHIHERVSGYTCDEIEILDPANHYHAEIQTYKRLFPIIAAECESARTILDVGCGTGHLLERLSIYPELYKIGIELNSKRAEIARKVSNCEIFQVPVEEFTSEKKFDVITMINVLSHIPSFDSLFYSIRSLISENGKLVIKVGEMKKDVKKRDIFDWGIPDHLHFLGLKTVDFISRKYGFNVIKHSRMPLSDELFSSYTWKSPGRSAFRNVIKDIVVHIPYALKVLARYYDLTHRKRIYSSFIVLSPQTQ
ncbi:class I SAM-dependent methyltransferase [Candidatus Latescibacterota bacterium]